MITDADKVWLKYLYRGFKFEFVDDHLEVTDMVYKRKYKITFTADEINPFRVELIKQD